MRKIELTELRFLLIFNFTMLFCITVNGKLFAKKLKMNVLQFCYEISKLFFRKLNYIKANLCLDNYKNIKFFFYHFLKI